MYSRPKTRFRGRENSRTATRPPGLATRTISASPRSVSVTFRSPNATATTWNVSVANGSDWASASTNRTRPAAPAAVAFFAARSSISGQKSAPTIATPPPAARS